MPNWCENYLVIGHDDPKKVEEIKKLLDKDEGFLSKLLPCPDDLKIEAGYFGDTDKGSEMQKLYDANKKKYGSAHWYDWQIAKWGTKWDITNVCVSEEDETEVSLHFDTAWSPPLKAYARLEEMGYKIYATYNEMGCAFCGIWEDGSNEYYEYGGFDSKQVKESIPEELDDCYCISSYLEQCEEEEAEEAE